MNSLTLSVRKKLLVALVGITFLALFFLPPIPQHQVYHGFADQRGLGGIPNFGDVISNVPFFFIGLFGLWSVSRTALTGFTSWFVFFLGVTLVSFGSGYYHWYPNDERLVWDRLPMTFGFMGLFIALLSDFVEARLERQLLFPAVGAGVLSVFYWVLTDDLRFYYWVQFMPMLAVPYVLLVFPAPQASLRLARSHYWMGLAFYALAKIAELADQKIYALTFHLISGHTLKHLLAAGACISFARMVHLRTRSPK